MRKYIELDNIFSYHKKELYKYFYISGIKDGQNASPAFYVKYYLDNNDDLKMIYGDNFTATY